MDNAFNQHLSSLLIPGVQTTVSSFDLSSTSVSHTAFGTVMTSTQLKPSSKRPRLDLEEDDEDTFQECSSILTAQETDVTFDPASITEPKDLS